MDRATLAVDLIDEVARRQGGSFTATDHTLAPFRGQWHPRWLDRHPWRGEQAEQEHQQKLLASIDAYIRQAVARYEPPGLDEDKLGAARELRARAQVEPAKLPS